MGINSQLKNKIKIIAGVFFLTFALILWEYFNGGVVTHHLLASEDLPGFSNWWGLLTIPVLTWLVIILINRRKKRSEYINRNRKNNTSKILTRFFSAFVFGILLSVLWEFGFENILQYLILVPIFLAFF